MTSPDHRCFDHRYYTTTYTNYSRQNPPHKLDWYHKLLTAALTDVSAPRVLDAGCAFGAFITRADPSWRCFGADVSRYALGKARNAVSRASFTVASTAALPFHESFDAVSAFDVLEHIHDLDATARSVLAALKAGGVFLFVVPVYDGITGPAIRLLDRDSTHVHKRSRHFWLMWAKNYFELCSWTGIFRCLLPWGSYAHLPTRTLKKCSPAIAVIARKKS